MNEFRGLKVGDKVVLKGWEYFKPRVTKFEKFNCQNEKTKWDFDTGYVKIELDWSEYGFASSSINAHDENQTWFRFSSAN